MLIYPRFNDKWKIVFEKTNDDITLVIPSGSEIYWFGADENPTRTGSDAQTTWAEVRFTYTSGGWSSSAGVRLLLLGFKEKNAGGWSVDTARWNTIMDMGV
ncbi:hypothetical protein ACHWQZ_G018400 [Mnemiopsis leidyi]